MWVMLIALQIITHLPLFFITMPSSALQIYASMITLMKFDILEFLPLDSVKESLGMTKDEPESNDD